MGFEGFNIKWGVWFGNGDRMLTNVEEELSQTAFEVFPNPVNEVLTITSEIEDTSQGSLKITDVMGRVIYNDILFFGKEKTIDVSSLPQGQYILTVTSKDGVGSKSFVKQ